MRVVIDATPVLLRSAGVKNYIYHWLRSLREAGGEAAFPGYPFIGRLAPLNHDASIYSTLSTYARIAMLHLGNVSGSATLDVAIRGADLFHASNQVKYPPNSVPFTATVHDMTCWISPERHTAANVRADRRFAERFLRKAAGIIAVSECTRQDLLRFVDIPPERVTAIHSGVAREFFADGPRFASAKPYVLYVGTIEPRKNLDTLLDAWAAVRPELREEFDLVLAGSEGWNAGSTMARLRTAAGVRYLGYVDEKDLPALNRGARLFVYPSLYEGFGFPVAQAMAAGVPVVTSAVSSLPEVAGDAALLVDPRSATELRRAIERLLEDSELAAALGSKGRERAQLFRWERCAAQSIEFFKKAAGRERL